MTFLHFVLAQAPPAPVPVAPSDLRPVYLTAGGALAGILITLLIQSINSRLQRRHENQGRAFDLRFKLYTRYLFQVRRFIELIEPHHTEISQQAIKDVNAARLERTEARERLTAGTARITERIASGNISKDEANRLVGELTKYKDDLEAAAKRHKDAIERVSIVHKDLQRNLVKASRIFNELRKGIDQVQVLGDTRTLLAFAQILETMKDDKPPTVEDQARFRKAVRRELGISRRPAFVREIGHAIKKQWRKIRSQP